VHSASYQIEYQSLLGIPGRLGKVKDVERGTDHTTSLRTVGQENVARYLHPPMHRSRRVGIAQGIALSFSTFIG